MKTQNVPGFTAESALVPSRNVYTSGPQAGTTQGAEPAAQYGSCMEWCMKETDKGYGGCLTTCR